MPDKNQRIADQLRQLLEPVLELKGPDAETGMGRTVGQALVLPPAEKILAEAIPPESVADFRDHAVEWLREVLRPELLPKDLRDRMYAVRKATNDEDAFIAVWRVAQRTLQAIVTRERVHVLTSLDGVRAGSQDQAAVQAALALAEVLLRLPEKPEFNEWVVRPFGGLVLGYREVDFAKDWHQALLIVTDGIGVKYSALKYKDRLCEEQSVTVGGPPVSWFPQP